MPSETTGLAKNQMVVSHTCYYSALYKQTARATAEGSTRLCPSRFFPALLSGQTYPDPVCVRKESIIPMCLSRPRSFFLLVCRSSLAVSQMFACSPFLLLLMAEGRQHNVLVPIFEPEIHRQPNPLALCPSCVTLPRGCLSEQVFWTNPIAWAFRAAVLNEFQASDYDDSCTELAADGSTCKETLGEVRTH